MFPACDIYSVSCFVITYQPLHFFFILFFHCSIIGSRFRVDSAASAYSTHFKTRSFTLFLLYCSPALKSVDQIQHLHTSAWPIRVRWGWSRDGGPWGQQPISVSGCVNKGCASASVGRLNGTLFMSTLGSFKEARRGDIAEFRFRKKKTKTHELFTVAYVWVRRRGEGMRRWLDIHEDEAQAANPISKAGECSTTASCQSALSPSANSLIKLASLAQWTCKLCFQQR